MNEVKQKHPGITIIRPSRTLCDETACDVAIGDTLIYESDGSHLTPTGARLMGKAYLERFENPLRQLQE